MSNYRYDFIKKYPGVRRFGRKGYWYRCASCGKWCGRPGSDNVNIKESERMEVDHIVPWAQGGSDEVWNLQPMCKPCNRSKSASMGVRDNFRGLGNAIVHPMDALSQPFRKAARNSKVLKGLGITKRK